MTLEKETSIYQLGAIAGKFEDIEDFVATKNSIFHQPDAPSTSGRKVGDIWYDSDDGYSMYKFDGTTWVREQYGTNAISVGAVTAARLDAQDVYTNFLRVYFLSAAQAEIDSLSAITANLGSVNVGGVDNEDGVITIKDASNQTIGYWDNTGINAQAGAIGPWTIGASGIYNGKQQYGTRVNGTYIGTDGIEIESNYGWIEEDPSAGIKIYSKSRNYVFGLDVADDYAAATIYPGGYQCITEDLQTAAEMGMNSDTYGFIGLTDTRQGHNRSIELDSGDPGIFLQVDSDTGILKTAYSSGTVYNLIRNHNNGNISVSASGAGLYLGYENTTQINFLNGKATLVSGGAFSVVGQIISLLSSGQAAVYAANSATGNRIFMYADASNGQAGLYSYSADNTPRAILVRANNSSVITTYGDWVFSNVVPWKTDIKGRPMISDSADGSRVSLLTSGASGRVGIQAQFGNTGTTYSIGYFSVAASDIRLKKNIEDSTVDALSLVNAIKVREFDWEDGRHQRIGMVADELEELDKALTIGGGYTDDNEMSIKSVDTFYLVGYLVKAVQELSAEIDRLKGAA